MFAESDGPDFSELPDAILSSILSLLPIEESARTSILSTRWRHQWKATTLRLDDCSLLSDKPRRVGRPKKSPSPVNPLSWCRQAVSTIFHSHYGPVESLSLSCFTDVAFHSTVDCYVESAVQRGIRELTLEYEFFPVPYQLLPSLLHCKSLHQLSLTGCRFREPVLPSIFPNLNELKLASVELTNDLFQILLSNCASLDTLHLISCWGIPVVNVSSPRLQKFVWDSSANELVIEDAPNLGSLMLGEYNTSSCKVKVQYAPKLELLGLVCVEIEELQLGETYFKKQVLFFC
jgi:F-box domain